ncbi:unnamed protein product [Danaus chrysippus]|uniref:(African queen) hypothetical protein n=1 Tax=Danaus chrysippus TaxID=151541 RepID=A0A8J2QYM9_9NEOP|nr:unnamed protein product [Danaus chrysippus]
MGAIAQMKLLGSLAYTQLILTSDYGLLADRLTHAELLCCLTPAMSWLTPAMSWRTASARNPEHIHRLLFWLFILLSLESISFKARFLC